MINDEFDELNREEPNAGEDIPPEEACRDADPRRDADPPAILAPDAMRLLLEGVCNLTRNQANKVIDEGYDSLPEFIYWSHGDIKAWCTGKIKLPPT